MPANSLRPFRHQPLAALIKERKLTYPAVVYGIGLPVDDRNVNSLRQVAYGLIYPSAHMRRELPKFLGVPLEQLFEERVLKGSSHPVGRKRREGGDKPCTTPSTLS